MNNDSRHSRGRTLLTAFTPDQRADVYAFLSTYGAADADRLVHEAAIKAGAPPALAFLDVPSISDEDVSDLLAASTVVLRDAMTGQWSAQDYAAALVRGAGAPSELALKIAEDDIVTPDTNVRAWAWKIADWIPDIPVLPFDEALRSAINLGGASIATLLSALDANNYSGDVLYEWLRLGRALRELRKRSALAMQEAAIESTGSAATASSALQNGVSDSGAIMKVFSRLGSIMKQLTSESGDPAEHEALHAELGDIRDVLSDVSATLQQAAPSPYDAFVDANPEFGGPWGWIKKKAKQAGRIAAGIASSPVGGLIAQGVASTIPGGSKLSDQLKSLPLPSIGVGQRQLKRLASSVSPNEVKTQAGRALVTVIVNTNGGSASRRIQ